MGLNPGYRNGVFAHTFGLGAMSIVCPKNIIIPFVDFLAQILYSSLENLTILITILWSTGGV